MSWLVCSFMTCVLMLLFALVLLVDGFPSRCFFIYRVFLLLIKIPKKTCNCFPDTRERMCHTSSQFHSISSGRVIPRSGSTVDSNQIRSLVQGLVLIHPIKWNLQFGCLANQTLRTLLLTNPKSGTGATLLCILVWLPFIYCNEVFHIANSSFMNLGVMQPSH